RAPGALRPDRPDPAAGRRQRRGGRPPVGKGRTGAPAVETLAPALELDRLVAEQHLPVRRARGDVALVAPDLDRDRVGGSLPFDVEAEGDREPSAGGDEVGGGIDREPERLEPDRPAPVRLLADV